MNKRKSFILACSLLLLSTTTQLRAQESLAPPHAPLIEGQAVPVTAHPRQQTLLRSPLPALAANKRLVFDYWRSVMLGGRADAAGDFLSPDYIEHNPLLPNGREAFLEHLASTLAPSGIPESLADLVTIVAEGDKVVLTFVTHYPEPDGSGSYTSTHFEMFRLDAGKIAEHWDSALFRAGQRVPDYGANKASPVLGVHGAAQLPMIYNDDPQLLANKRLVFDLWRQIPEAGREELLDLYMDPIYIQHNPNAATGREGARAYFARRPDTSIESWYEAPLVAMLAEGDLVVQVLETEREQNGVTYKVPWFDMFRIENGLAVEHWDTASKGELPPIMQENQTAR